MIRVAFWALFKMWYRLFFYSLFPHVNVRQVNACISPGKYLSSLPKMCRFFLASSGHRHFFLEGKQAACKVLHLIMHVLIFSHYLMNINITNITSSLSCALAASSDDSVLAQLSHGGITVLSSCNKIVSDRSGRNRSTGNCLYISRNQALLDISIRTSDLTAS